MKVNLKPLIIALTLLVGLYILLGQLNFSQKKTEIYYDKFLNELQKGNISKVQIQGDKLEGVFTNSQEFFVYSPFDESLIGELKINNVAIEVKKFHKQPWYIVLLLHWGPLLFLIGIWIFIFSRNSSGGNMIFSIGKSKAKRVIEDTKVAFKDIAGIEETKEEVTEIVEFLKNPERYARLGSKIPKGVILVGPPGTGKTLLAKAIAGEAKVPFFSIAGSEFVEMFVGVGASRVRSLFQEAKINKPCIIFIDEIDAVGRKRGSGLGSGHDEREQTLNQLLSELDGFEINRGVIVIAATNRIDILDKAILRPGRFDRHIHISLPDIVSREAILEVHAKKVKMAKNINLKDIAKTTHGFSGAQLANLINEATLHCIKNNEKEVSQENLNFARDKVVLGLERKSMKLTTENKKNVARFQTRTPLSPHSINFINKNNTRFVYFCFLEKGSNARCTNSYKHFYKF